MATIAVIQLTIPDPSLNRIVDALCSYGGYQANLTNEDGTVVPNPQTKAQFAKAGLIKFVKQVVKNEEGNVAAQVARASNDATVDALNIT